MRSRYAGLIAAPLIYLCQGCFWIRYSFAAPGWETRALWPHAVIMLGLGSIVGGLLQERFDSARVGYVGAALFGLGFIGAGFTSTTFPHYLSNELLIGFGSGMAYAAGIPLAVRVFPDKVGLAIGIAVCGYVPATIIGSRIVTVLVEETGRSTAALLTGIALASLTALGIRVLRGLASGDRAASADAGSAPMQTMRTRSFPSLWLSYALGSTAAVVVYTNFPAHLSSVVARQNNAQALALLGLVSPLGSLANCGARPAAGWLCDVMGGFKTQALSLALIAAGSLLAAVLWLPETLLAVPVMVLGGYGAMLAIYPTLAARLYGLPHLGANYGILFSAWAVGFVAGTTAAPLVAQAFDSPVVGLYAAALVSLLAVWLAARSARPAPVPNSALQGR